jgi:signal transduction histidine kinase
VSAKSELVHIVHQRNLDNAPEENATTTPSETEAITFRSVTLAEVYIGTDLKRFLTRLKSLAEPEAKYEVTPSIENSILYDRPTVGNFTIRPMSDRANHRGSTYCASLPSGISTVNAKYYLLGPNCLAVNFTFCLDAEAQGVIDSILRSEAEPQLKVIDGTISFLSVSEVKRNKCSSEFQSYIARCQSWAHGVLPGTLNSIVTEPIPAIVGLTTREEMPFLSKVPYMRLLGLSFPAAVLRVFDPAPVFLSQRLTNIGPYRFILSAREPDLMTSNSISPIQLSAMMNETAGPIFVLNALDALVKKADRNLRRLRTEIIELSVDKGSNQKLANLRIRLSELSRLISTISHEFRSVLSSDHLAWSGFPSTNAYELATMSKPSQVLVQNFLHRIEDSCKELQQSSDQLVQQSAIMASAIGDSLRIDQERTLSRFNKMTIVLAALLFAATIVLGVVEIHISDGHTVIPTTPTTTTTSVNAKS